MTPDDKSTTSSDDEEFQAGLDDYLNSSVSSETQALQGILKRSSSFNKVVKFADIEEEPKSDEERTQQELISKVKRITRLLKQAEDVVKAEKDKRKKKDKNLMKLAKELKRRNAQRDADMDRFEELEEKKKYLEHHWVLAQKELDQEKSLRSKIQAEMKEEYERSLKEERQKHERDISKHEARIAELKAIHAKQCDELCGQILKANLEADRLANQIRSDGYTPRGFSGTLTDSSFGTKISKFLAACVAVIAVFGYRVDMFSIDGICAPVMPGRTLRSRDSGSSFSSPWWAPEQHKAEAYDTFCSESKEPTLLEWLPDGKDNKIVLSSDNKVIFTKRSVVKAEIEGSNLRVWNRKGGSEEHGSLWSV